MLIPPMTSWRKDEDFPRNGNGHNMYIPNVHIANGFAEDCEEFISWLPKREPLNYETFCNIWKIMNFGSLFHGRGSSSELAELSEEVLQIAKAFMVRDTSNFEASVAGLFLVYALLLIQPYNEFASLRLLPDDMVAINRIELVARREGRFDVLFVLYQITTKCPVECQSEIRDYGMELPYRKYLEGYNSNTYFGLRSKGVIHRQNEEFDVMKDIDQLCQRYKASKAALNMTEADILSLHYVDPLIPKKLNSSLLRLINCFVKDSEDLERTEPQSSNRSATVQAIKAKAMSSTAAQLKHLTGVTERNVPGPSTNLLSEIRCKPGKVKTGSPKKPLATGSPKKRQLSPVYKNSRKRVLDDDTTETETDSDYEAMVLDDDSDDDINLDGFDLEGTEALEREIEQDQQELNIQIESLPVFIRTQAENKLIEIEIIDHQAKETEKVNLAKEVTKVVTKGKEIKGKMVRGKKTKEAPKLSYLPEVSITKISKPADMTIEQQTNSEMAQISKIVNTEHSESTPQLININLDNQNDPIPDIFNPPTEIKRIKKTKRELKKPILKSKFKKMGILSVANFKDTK